MFCLYEEVPILIQRARSGDLQLLPLFAEPFLWDNEPWLRRGQMLPTDGKAVSQYDDPAMNRLVTEFTRRIRDAVEAPAKAGDGPSTSLRPHTIYTGCRRRFSSSSSGAMSSNCWTTCEGGDTNLAAFTAGAGGGKSTLARV